ncbi:MAG: hypothetical protein LAT68_00550 [Cyclobacteriaceae bacterium]|nr:hypothetical protein [Cyclobacteriaceae bacterium]MCH8514792.1 hypothetical protein [Cyclobacteriaceae bacterium]
MTEAHEDLLDRYFAGEATDAERQEIKSLLGSDEAFARAYAEYEFVIESLKMQEAKKELKNRFAEFHEEDRSQEDKSRMLIPRTPKNPPKWWYMAASFILLSVVFVYASQQLGWIDWGINWGGNKESIAAPHPSKNKEKTDALDWEGLTRQAGILDHRQNNLVQGAFGLRMEVPAGALLDAEGKHYRDSVYFLLREMEESTWLAYRANNPMGWPEEEVFEVFYIEWYNGSTELSPNPLFPPQLLVQLPKSANYEVDIYYGSLEQGRMQWSKNNSRADDELIKEPTAEMDAYQRYREGLDLLTRVDLFYEKKGDTYIFKGTDSKRLTVAFVEDIRRYVVRYEQDPNFASRVARAQAAWKRYEAQRTLVINHKAQSNDDADASIMQEHAIPILQSGWQLVRVKRAED